MKQLCCVIFAIVGVVLKGNAQVYNLIGTNGDEFSQSGAQLTGGDFVVFGHSKNISGQQDAWIARTNNRGENTKTYKFGGSGVESGYGCVAAQDGGYAVTGSTTSSGAGNNDVFVVKFNPDNSIQWQYTFGGTGDDVAYEIISTTDSGFLVVGYTRSFGNTGYNSYILKLSSTGTLQWNKVFYSASADIVYRCLEFQGYYYISNTINISSSFGMGDVHLTKLDKNGNFIWNKAYGAGRNENGWKMIATLDNKLAMIFASSSYTGGANKELVFMKLDTAGKMLFASRFTNNGKATDGFDLVQLKDSSFVITGHTLDAGPAGWRGILVKLDKNGGLLKAWYTSFADEGNLWQIKKTQKTGEFALFGNGKHSTRGNYDFILGIADSTFALSCLDWKVMSLADVVTTSPGEKLAKTAFSITSGANIGNPGWGLVIDSNSSVVELNYNPNYGTTMPAIIYRCAVDSIKLDAGAHQRYWWSTGAVTRTTYARDFGTYYLKFMRNYCIGYDSVRIIKTNPDPILLSNDTCGRNNIVIGVPQVAERIYEWNTGDKTNSILVSASGKYKIIITDTAKKCVNSDSIQVMLPGITASLTSDSFDHCLKSNYQALSAFVLLETQNDKVKSYQWYDGDARIPGGYNFLTYTANDTGFHRLSLAIRSEKGCFDSLEYSFVVYPNPAASFVVSERRMCYRNDQPVFINRSSPEGMNYSHSWNWGDGTETLGSDTAIHQFPGFGKYRVVLNCINEKGCADNMADSIELLAYPKAVLISSGKDIQCIKGNDFQFVSNSNCADSNRELFHSWMCSDGSGTTDSMFQKQFSNPGRYEIKLVVITDQGCADSILRDIEVYPGPVIRDLRISPATACINENSFAFTVDPDTLTGPRYFYSGDGGEYFNKNNVVHRYKSTGIFNALFIAGNDLGCLDSARISATVLPSPKALISATDSAQCLYKNLFSLSAKNPDPGDIFSWQISDGSNYSGSLVAHTFTIEGLHNARLIATGSNGCKDTAMALLLVYPQPVADFASKPVCEGFDTEFIDSSSVSSGIITGYKWHFNGTAADTTPVAKYRFPAAGNYDAALVVSTRYGCTDSIHKTGIAKVYPSPAASFTWEIESESLEEDQWLARSGVVNAAGYEWRSSSGEFGFRNTFRHTVSDSHTLWLTHIVIDQNGCRDTLTDSRIFPFYANVFIPNAFTPNSDKHNPVFRPVIQKKLKDYSLRIFDRWGEILFHTDDPLEGWDGNVKGEPAQDGIYVYKIVIGTKYNFGGTIHLIR